MDRNEFAHRLLDGDPEERKSHVSANPELCDAALAAEFQEICYEVWTTEPQRVSEIVRILGEIRSLTGNDEIGPYLEWTRAIEHLVKGDLESSLEFLDQAEQSFLSQGKRLEAAKTRPAKIYVLALNGRYDAAVECGRGAIDVLIEEGDLHAAGKIEHNLGNIFWRRDLYDESEPFLASAHERFLRVGDQRQLAMVENCQAFVRALKNDFRGAEEIYSAALQRAKRNDLTVTQAEIEIGISNLYLFQGRLDLALSNLENARRKYDLLEMPIQSANCELEIADVYLELNLLPEAMRFFVSVEKRFSELGMKAERARSLLGAARTATLLGDLEKASAFLNTAEEIAESEGNPITIAYIKLLRGEVLAKQGNPVGAKQPVTEALTAFRSGGNERHAMFSAWLLGEITASLGDADRAEEIFRDALEAAEGQSRQVAYLCLLSLGRLLRSEEYFRRATDLVEASRAELAAGELRTAFFADRVGPYLELAKLSLGEGKIEEAFRWHERARARSLLDSIHTDPSRAIEDERLQELEKKLNWYYSRINRESDSGLSVSDQRKALKTETAEIEREYAELERRLGVVHAGKTGRAGDVDLSELQNAVRGGTLVEFVDLGDVFSAFVVTGDGLRFFDLSADSAEIRSEVSKFRFQIKTARFHGHLSEKGREIALKRLRRHSRRLYDLLFRPLEGILEGGRLTVVPADVLFYLPFQALHDGEEYLLDRYEISYAPSSTVFLTLRRREAPSFERALVVGVNGNGAPHIGKEVEAVSALFGESEKVVDKNANFEAIRDGAARADALHFACHGIFRPDNPDFSSLVLHDENLTVKQVRGLDLSNRFVSLSACETGLNRIVSGEELVGLTGGFISAGASSLLLSLWAVNDEETRILMEDFYTRVTAGAEPGEALRTAQLNAKAANAHPYFWAPFVLVGR